jgi:hypothetical protein
MKRIASCYALFSAGLVLAAISAFSTFSTVDGPEQCGVPISASVPFVPSAISPVAVPTLAPPRSVVLVKVECDRSDIAVSWAEN